MLAIRQPERMMRPAGTARVAIFVIQVPSGRCPLARRQDFSAFAEG
jgi:hypothetical protein